ncbi:hypothetical protein [Ferrovibrio xuzhouensis]|uniref:RDD family protein n=1 Tax=Ferrovibrio xuzhouensis TaxID=1576914 RepID=A0ABV7VLU0_9PROT
MGFKVITGTLEATGDRRTSGEVTTWNFLQIHDDDGNDHLVKDVQSRELMFAYLLTVPTHGSFVIAEHGLPKVVGLATEGRVVQDYASWEAARQFWRKFRRICGICLVAPILYMFLFVDMKHRSEFGHVSASDVLVTLMTIFGPILVVAWLIAWGGMRRAALPPKAEFDAIIAKLKKDAGDKAAAA